MQPRSRRPAADGLPPRRPASAWTVGRLTGRIPDRPTGYHGDRSTRYSAVFTAAVTVIAAVVAATGAGLAAPALLGRPLAVSELAAIALVFGAIGWGLTTSRQRRQRKRILEMRDSALW